MAESGKSTSRVALTDPCIECNAVGGRRVRRVCGNCYSRHKRAGTLDAIPKLDRPRKPRSLSKHAAWMRKYNERPDVKARKKARYHADKLKPEWAERRRAYLAEYMSRPDGQVRRRDRMRERRLLRQYGLSLSAHEAMYAAQRGLCKICQTPGDRWKLHVDHCHATGNVRGMLCKRCNTLCGYLEKSAGILQRTVDYLGGKL